ncbi:hypothetical protein D3C87_163030 [compost metagenome]
MQTSNLFKVALVSLSLLSAPALVWAAQDSSYEEVSYDDLLNELSAKQKKITKESASSFDDVRLHAGIGYVNAFTNLATNNKNFNRHASGIQLSLGMDLFSPQWYSEGVFRNYGTTTEGSEDLSIKELDIKIGYTDKLESIWNYTLSAGLSNRFLKFKDSTKGISVDETTPSFVISSGFMAQVHKRLSLGAELSARTAMINKSADKNSVDFAFRLTTSL